MTASVLVADQSACIRASLLHDGEGLSLELVAATLGCGAHDAARRIALGRLMAVDGLAVIPRDCTPHLAGFVMPTSRTAGHFRGCTHCRHLADSMAAGVRLAQLACGTTDASGGLEGLDEPAAQLEVPTPPRGRPIRPVTPAPPPLSDPLDGVIDQPADPDTTATFGLVRVRIQNPAPRTPARTPTLGSDHEVLPVRVQRQPHRRVRTLRGVVLVVVAVLIGGWIAAPMLRGAPVSAAVQRHTSLIVKSVGVDEARVGDPYYTATWDRLADCMSGGNWMADGGGLVISPQSWRLVGGQGLPAGAGREEQIHRAIALWELQGWSAWPGCAQVLGWH